MALINMVMRQKSFKRDIAIENKLSRLIKAILGNYFITKDIQADLQEATDFMVLSVKPFRVAVRLRRYKYWENLQYRQEFTIRYSRPSGVETEIDKIRKGYVDYILYGFVDRTEKRIIAYFIGDLSVFNQILVKPLFIKSNLDGSSELAIYGLHQFPSEFIVKQYREN